jgi:hypothetical protein
VLAGAVGGDAPGLGPEGLAGGGASGVLSCPQDAAADRGRRPGGSLACSRAVMSRQAAGVAALAASWLARVSASANRAARSGASKVRVSQEILAAFPAGPAEGGLDGDVVAVTGVAARVASGRGGVGHGDGDRVTAAEPADGLGLRASWAGLVRGRPGRQG